MPQFQKMKWKLLITNHVKEYVLTRHDDNNFAGKPPTN